MAIIHTCITDGSHPQLQNSLHVRVQGCTVQQEGFGVRHLDPLHVDLKFSTHSSRFTRDNQGINRLQFKQYMRDQDWRPTPEEGPPAGHRLFVDSFKAQAKPELPTQSMTAYAEGLQIFKYLKVNQILHV